LPRRLKEQHGRERENKEGLKTAIGEKKNQGTEMGEKWRVRRARMNI
jgi:hypothetical protein